MAEFNKEKWSRKVADIKNQNDATLAQTITNLDNVINDFMQIANKLFKEGNQEAGVRASALCDEAKSLRNIASEEQMHRRGIER